MALSDADRALMILNEYRRTYAKNLDVLANNDSASEINIDTSLDFQAANALAAKIAADNVHPRVFPVTIEGLLWLDQFEGGPPQWMTVLQHDAVAEPMKAFSTRCSFVDGTSRIEVRG